MTYSSENFSSAIEARRPSIRRSAEGGEAFAVASRKAAGAVERARWTAGSLVETYTYWRSVRETTRQLSLLDDAALRDVGLDRGQIPSVARRLALKKQRPATGPTQHRAD